MLVYMAQRNIFVSLPSNVLRVTSVGREEYDPNTMSKSTRLRGFLV